MPDDPPVNPATEHAGAGGNDTHRTAGDNTGALPGRPAGTARPRRRAMAVVFAAAALAFTAVGFGATLVIRDQLSTASASSAIPTPPTQNQTFVEDDDGTGADSQANILQSTVPGLVRIVSAHGTGTGVILTPSGLMLTSAQVAAGRQTVSARVLPSGHGYPATVVRSDLAHDLTLLQLEGGGTFRPVAIGTARELAAGDAAIAVAAGASGRAFTPVIGNVSGTNAATAIGGHRLTGLLRTTAQIIPGQSAGGPLVNLSGQMIGIDLTGSARGTSATSYAIPVNDALAVASQLKRS